jgi:hypothetical protein
MTFRTRNRPLNTRVLRLLSRARVGVRYSCLRVGSLREVHDCRGRERRARGPVPDGVYCPVGFERPPATGPKSLRGAGSPRRLQEQLRASLGCAQHLRAFEAGADPEVMIAACPSSVTVSCGGVARLVQSLAGN